MLNRILILSLVLFAPARAQDAFDPATVMPPGTVAYAEFDAAALQRGFGSLDLVRTVLGEEFKSFFAPLRAELPVEELKSMKPVRDWVAGRAAVGLSGFSVRIRGMDGKYERVRFAPGAKVDPRIFNLLMVSELARSPRVILEFEGVAVIEPGEELRRALDGFLEKPPVPFTHKFVQRGDRQILTLKFEPFSEEGFWYAPEIHADLTGDRWILASSAELLRAATGQRSSLREDEGFLAARARHTSGERVFFLYADFARAYEVAKPLVPALVRDALVLNGLESVRNAVVGVSIVDGGVRESFGIGLKEKPTGFWKLFEACPPGLGSIRKFSPRVAGLLALKFDPARFDQLFAETTAQLLPGVGKLARESWVAGLLELGIDYDTELLPAFGDERALAFFPSGGFVPEMLLGADVRDQDAFAALVTKLRAALGDGPVQLKQTEEGWKLSGPMPAQLRIHDGHLLAATSPATLRRVIAGWAAPEKTMAKDAEVFRRVMQALNGGKTDDLIALIYGDIQNWLPTLMVMGAASGALEGPFNPNPMPDVRKLARNFSGLAIGIRRDRKGIALESFAPAGLMSYVVPLFWAGAANAAPFIFELD